MEQSLSASLEEDLSQWLSTYGLVTVEKIFERYQIRFAPETLFRVLHNPKSIFFRFIKIPLKNIFNGLILQQGKDYLLYLQKLYIDYLLSGESGQEESQVCADLEQTRQTVVSLSEAFNEEEARHIKLITRSQIFLLKLTRHFNQQLGSSAQKMMQAFSKTGFMAHDEQMFVKVLQTLLCDYQTRQILLENKEAWSRVDRLLGQAFELSLRELLVQTVEKLSHLDEETQQELHDFMQQCVEMTQQLKYFRKEFSAKISETNVLISSVGGYRIDEAQLAANQEELNFDTTIGDEQ